MSVISELTQKIFELLSDSYLITSMTVGIVTSIVSNALYSTKVFKKIYELIYEKIKTRNKQMDDNEKFKSILGIMFKKRIQEAKTISGMISSLLLVYFSVLVYFNVSPDKTLLVVATTLMILPWIKLSIVVFRVRNEFIGGDESEIRELITFILNEANEDDLNSGNGPKKLIDLQDFDGELSKVKTPVLIHQTHIGNR